MFLMLQSNPFLIFLKVVYIIVFFWKWYICILYILRKYLWLLFIFLGPFSKKDCLDVDEPFVEIIQDIF